MKKTLLTAMIMVALVATAGAQDNKPTEAKRTFKERSEVVADSIRAKAPRVGRRIAERSVVIADSIGEKGARAGQRAKVIGDTVAVRSKKAWKAIKGE